MKSNKNNLRSVYLKINNFQNWLFFDLICSEFWLKLFLNLLFQCAFSFLIFLEIDFIFYPIGGKVVQGRTDFARKVVQELERTQGENNYLIFQWGLSISTLWLEHAYMGHAYWTLTVS